MSAGIITGSGLRGLSIVNEEGPDGILKIEFDIGTEMVSVELAS